MPAVRTPAVAQLLVDAYITGLRQRLPTLCLQQLDRRPAASEAQLHHLCQAYPNAPIELLYLLQRFNGSNWDRTATAPSTPSVPPTESTPSSAAAAPAAATASGGKPTVTTTAAKFIKNTLVGRTPKKPGGPSEYPGGLHARRDKTAVPVLGSALESCPYFLKSVEQILGTHSFLVPRAGDGAASGEQRLSGREWTHPHNLRTLFADYHIVQPTPAPSPAEPAPDTTNASKPTVCIDPRIDIEANLSNWLEFAESLHFELLPQPTTPPPTEAAPPSATTPPLHATQPESKPTTHKMIESYLFVDFKPAESQGGVVGQVVQYVRNDPDSFTVIAKNFGDYLKHIVAEEYQFTEVLEDDDEDDDVDSPAAAEVSRDGSQTQPAAESRSPTLEQPPTTPSQETTPKP